MVLMLEEGGGVGLNWQKKTTRGGFVAKVF